jgi:hypothetical protein
LKKEFSLVIPTLYGAELEKTLIQIHKGTCIPSEIIIVIPIEFQNNIQNILSFKNVKIIAVEFRGQVNQRIHGFKLAKFDIVIQLDDDIIVDPNCFKSLVETIINSDFPVAISPLFKFTKSNKSCYPYNKKNYILNKLIHGSNYLVSGKITSSGLNMGIFHSEQDQRYFDSEWVPGGCLAHKKSNLYLENYFPFIGKAYFEDVYHSVLLRKKSIKLLVDNRAICYIDPLITDNFSSNLEEYLYFKKYRKHLIKLINGSLFRLNLEYFLYVILYIKNKILPK